MGIFKKLINKILDAEVPPAIEKLVRKRQSDNSKASSKLVRSILRILGIILVVISLLVAIAVPPAGIAGIIFGIVCIIKSRKKSNISVSLHRSTVNEKLEAVQNKLAEKNRYQAESAKSPISSDRHITLFQDQDFIIHDDIKDLLWIADGKYKNYTREPLESVPEYEYCGMRISFTIYGSEEPSLIYVKHPILKPLIETEIPRPSYYPDYSSLTPEQRYIYAKLLTNPYDETIDIGYVFILYYGLERHLLRGDFDSAFRVILKLRDIHKNHSFQSYSANALILSCMLQKKGEFILEFIKSLDKEHEYNFSPNLLLLCYYSFNITLLPKDIMRMASTFEFTNRNYIKKNPAIFEQCLSEIINNKYGPEGLHINRFITKTELSRIKMDNMRLFANMSLLDKEIPVPMLSENFRLKKEINALLIEAHEKTKKLLAAMRKKAPIGPKDQSSEIDKVVYTQRYIPDDSDEAKQIRTRQEAWKKMTPAERSKQAGTETKERMESTGLTMYVWETSGDERVCPDCRVMDGKLCLWADPMVYSRNKGKDWILRPKTAVKVHPGENICKGEGHCRCTAIAYYPELVGEL